MSNENGIHPPTKHVIVNQINRPAVDVVRRIAALRREIVFDYVGEDGLLDHALSPLLNHNWSFAGPAVTVKLDEPDILLPAYAVTLCQPGDVIFVSANGATHAAVWGGALSISAKAAHVAGVVIDGAVRSTESLINCDVPVFCRTRQTLGAPCTGHGSINVAITCGKTTIKPGDIILGNLDGICVIPSEKANEILIECEKKGATISKRADRLKKGQTSLFEELSGPEIFTKIGVRWQD